MMETLYRSGELGTLRRGVRSHSDRSRAALDSLARTVSTLRRPSRTATRPAGVRARPVQRQRSKIDEAMLARVTDPITYQGFQHFITHAIWDADRIWRRLLEVLPERSGVLIIDGTSFPK